MVTISLMRMGAKGKPFYRIVVKEKRQKRDGKYLEKVGSYNPMTHPSTVILDHERIQYWISVGAQPTDTVRSLIKHNPEGAEPKAIETRQISKGIQKPVAKPVEEAEVVLPQVENVSPEAETTEIVDSTEVAPETVTESAETAETVETPEAKAEDAKIEDATTEPATEKTEEGKSEDATETANL